MILVIEMGGYFMRRIFLAAALLFAVQLHARDCNPKMNCEVQNTCPKKVDTTDCSALAQGLPCPLKTDDVDCEPRWVCPSSCPWFDVSCVGSKAACEANKASYRAGCEQARAVHNAVYAAEKKACEAERAVQASDAQIAHRRENCEATKAAQNAIYASNYARCQEEITLEQQQCQRARDRLRDACQAGLRGPFSCDANEVMAMLSTKPQPFVDETNERGSALSGESGTPWMDTACEVRGTGIPYRDAVLSADGFWTIDLRVLSLSIGELQKPKGDRFIRLVIRPRAWGGGKAQEIANGHYITIRDTLDFAGALMIDRIPTASLEVHVGDELTIRGTQKSSH